MSKLTRLLKRAKKLLPTWKRDEQLAAENKNLLELISQVMDVNRGLNMSAGELFRQTEGLREESIQLLSAITFQHQGELIVKGEFFDVLAQPVNSNLNLRIERQDGGNVVLKLIPIDPPEEEDEKDE